VQLDGCVPAGVGRVAAWAGPWPIDERWWDPLAHRRRARFQVVLEQGSALLLMLEKGEWCVEAFYD
jgi:protein ImuB